MAVSTLLSDHNYRYGYPHSHRPRRFDVVVDTNNAAVGTDAHVYDVGIGVGVDVDIADVGYVWVEM